MGIKRHTLVEFSSMIKLTIGWKSGAFMLLDCAQIAPVKVKFNQIFPKTSKTAIKIYCIINMLKLCSF